MNFTLKPSEILVVILIFFTSIFLFNKEKLLHSSTISITPMQIPTIQMEQNFIFKIGNMSPIDLLYFSLGAENALTFDSKISVLENYCDNSNAKLINIRVINSQLFAEIVSRETNDINRCFQVLKNKILDDYKKFYERINLNIKALNQVVSELKSFDSFFSKYLNFSPSDIYYECIEIKKEILDKKTKKVKFVDFNALLDFCNYTKEFEESKNKKELFESIFGLEDYAFAVYTKKITVGFYNFYNYKIYKQSLKNPENNVIADYYDNTKLIYPSNYLDFINFELTKPVLIEKKIFIDYYFVIIFSFFNSIIFIVIKKFFFNKKNIK